MIRFFVPIFSLAVLLLSSCDPNKHPYFEFKSVQDQSWSYADTLQFLAAPADSGLYEVFLSVRYEKEYEFSNIWLKVQEGEESFRVEIPLFDPAGKPLGKCSGALCTQSVMWKEISAVPGDSIEWDVVQNMRKDPLLKIADVGIRLQKKQEASAR